MVNELIECVLRCEYFVVGICIVVVGMLNATHPRYSVEFNLKAPSQYARHIDRVPIDLVCGVRIQGATMYLHIYT